MAFILVNILSSGSQGNCSILTDKNKNQLVVDCGINYKQIAVNIIDAKKCVCCLSHEHGDHNLAKKDFVFNCIDVYSHDRLQHCKIETLKGVWDIMPIAVQHNVENFAFIIYNRIENKKIFWATDLVELPEIGNDFDLLAIECHHSKEVVENMNEEYKKKNFGAVNHHSLERLEDWLLNRPTKPNKLLLIHLSNNGGLCLKTAIERLKPHCGELFVAKRNLEIVF